MREIPLTRGKVAVVDDDDYERLNHHKWHVTTTSGGTPYAVRHIRKGRRHYSLERMHHVIANAESGVRIDHRDRDSLNNRKDNLRVATCAQNNRNRGIQKNNTSGFKGVIRGRSKWQARIKFEGKWIHLGQFCDPSEAAKAYDAKALELFGEFACTNSDLAREMQR